LKKTEQVARYLPKIRESSRKPSSLGSSYVLKISEHNARYLPKIRESSRKPSSLGSSYILKISEHNARYFPKFASILGNLSLTGFRTCRKLVSIMRAISPISRVCLETLLKLGDLLNILPYHAPLF